MASSCCAYEEDTSSGSEPSTNKPPIQAPALQESDDSEEEEEEESESDEAPPEPRTQPKGKSLSLEMSVFRLRIKRGLLNCTHCRRPLRPDTYNGRAYTCRRCVRGQIYCRQCIRLHHCRAADPQSTCKLLNHIIAQMKFKCDCNKYVPYCELLEHRRECPSVKYSKCNCKKYIPSCEFLEHRRGCRYAKCSTPAWWKCMLKASLQCSECEVPIRPPIFLLWSNNLICSACYRAGISTSRHCTELEYLLRGIKVKCIACKQYFPFSWLGSPRVGDCPFKRELQNIAPGSSARKRFCDEEETERPMAENNSIHGKNKRKVHFEVGKMDKHIFHGDEVASDDDSYDASYDDNHMNMKAPGLQRATVLSLVESDDGSSDDNHPESGMSVAENAFKTLACNKKAKIATPYGQKKAPTAAQAGTSRYRHLPITAPSKPPLPRRPGTRLFQAAHNRNRG